MPSDCRNSMVGIVRLKRHALDPPTRTFATECPLHQKRRHQAFHRVPRSDGTIEDVRRSSSQSSSDTSREQSQFQRRSTEETSKRYISGGCRLLRHIFFVDSSSRDLQSYRVISLITPPSATIGGRRRHRAHRIVGLSVK